MRTDGNQSWLRTNGPDVKKRYIGDWRIAEMECWDADYIDLVGPGRMEIGRDGTGSFHFGTVDAEIDSKEGKLGHQSRLEFTFEGSAEMDPCSGRGWAVVDGEEMTGRIYFHLGDDSGFKATRSG
ncbi:MAG: hypothetical protein HN742_43155 [Lentisphaerae bacterium]|nr:hypothetical protein [Lentisphaerota bacterium]MBT4822466.1 hypothetical protein [Lentisphaerota bacterium]MBT5604287.1 hypothetical protein [Lentisphaerota bacterium]MBT7054477.1 hypothetical protein [Lentisphaerota bacterium]MBT7848737.1 hypothetical protein [Lentisphaerota bacterium]